MVGDDRSRTPDGARLGYRHQKVQRLRKLFRRSAQREREGVFVIEGAKLLQEALAHPESVESIFVAPGTQHSTLVSAHELGLRVFELEAGIMDRVADAVTPQPICAIVSMHRSELSDLNVAQTVVVLVDIRDPGNAGTILRSAEAAGIDGMIFCEGSVDLWNPKTLRASAGSIFHVPVVTGVPAIEALEHLHHRGFVRAGTAMDGSAYDHADLTQRTALVFGNEANGLPDALRAHLDVMLSVPIEGRSESLNVSMAAAVMCFEVARQRRTAM